MNSSMLKLHVILSVSTVMQFLKLVIRKLTASTKDFSLLQQGLLVFHLLYFLAMSRGDDTAKTFIDKINVAVITLKI